LAAIKLGIGQGLISNKGRTQLNDFQSAQ